MSGLPFGVIVEGLVSVLLAVTIAYCLIVNRKLNALRADQAKLKEVVQALDRSTRNAENIIGELRDTASVTQDELDERIDYARSTLSRLTSVVSEANALMMRMGESPVSVAASDAPLAHKEMPLVSETPTPQAAEAPMVRRQVKTQMRLSNLMREAGKPNAVSSNRDLSATAKGTA